MLIFLGGFTLALVTGQSVADVSQNVMANLGWDEVRLPAPVYEGDTIYSESEVVSVRGSRSRPEVGIARPVAQWIRVDFPAPFGPSRPKKLPSGISSETPFRASTPVGYRLTSSSTRSAGGGTTPFGLPFLTRP